MQPLTTAGFVQACKGLALAALVIAALPAAASAAGTPAQRRACRADAMRLCREYVPNARRITACMERNRNKLSPACRAQFR